MGWPIIRAGWTAADRRCLSVRHPYVVETHVACRMWRAASHLLITLREVRRCYLEDRDENFEFSLLLRAFEA